MYKYAIEHPSLNRSIYSTNNLDVILRVPDHCHEKLEGARIFFLDIDIHGTDIVVPISEIISYTLRVFHLPSRFLVFTCNRFDKISFHIYFPGIYMPNSEQHRLYLQRFFSDVRGIDLGCYSWCRTPWSRKYERDGTVAPRFSLQQGSFTTRYDVLVQYIPTDSVRVPIISEETSHIRQAVTVSYSSDEDQINRLFLGRYKVSTNGVRQRRGEAMYFLDRLKRNSEYCPGCSRVHDNRGMFASVSNRRVFLKCFLSPQVGTFEGTLIGY
nr:MAG: hypothetical protein [Arizlama virus]